MRSRRPARRALVQDRRKHPRAEARVDPAARRVWGYLGQRKKYWLLPLVIVLVVFGTLVYLARQSASGPFNYTF